MHSNCKSCARDIPAKVIANANQTSQPFTIIILKEKLNICLDACAKIRIRWINTRRLGSHAKILPNILQLDTFLFCILLWLTCLWKFGWEYIREVRAEEAISSRARSSHSPLCACCAAAVYGKTGGVRSSNPNMANEIIKKKMKK